MELKELRIRVAKSNNTEWFAKVVTRISLPYINYEREFIGVASIYEFLSKGVAFWDGIGTGLPDNFQLSKQFFETALNQIDNILGSYIDHTPDQLNSYWQSWIQGNLNSYENNRPIPFDTPEAIFLANVYNNYNANQATGAYNFIARGNLKVSGNKEEAIGSYLGLQFASGEKTKAFSFLSGEKKNLEQLTTNWEKLILEGGNTISEYIKGAEVKFIEYTKELDELKIEKKIDFENWLKDAEISKTNLEITYKEQMKLKEPAEYWKKRSETLIEEGHKFAGILVIVTFFTCLSLYFLIFNTPTAVIELFKGNDYVGSIKWSILFVTFISFIAYIIRILARAMLSAYHLGRDAEERHSLTYFYLALSKDTTVEKEERLLIMQSLFSRSDSGLLNTDATPTLPSSIGDNLFKLPK